MACTPGVPVPPPAGSASSPPAQAGAAADTVRGTVEEVGSEPGTWMVLRTAGGAVVRLDGERPLLRAVVGLEVMVRGTPAPGGLGVRDLQVRASNGVAAVDGVLARRSGAYVLVTRDRGTLPVAHLPEALRGMVGGRVWLAGPLDRPPDSFGVLSEPGA
jgi:hypothetical protein